MSEFSGTVGHLAGVREGPPSLLVWGHPACYTLELSTETVVFAAEQLSQLASYRQNLGLQ